MLSLEEFKARSLMPSEDVDGLEARYPGFVRQRIVVQSSRIQTRLAKRYAPFVAPYPPVVLGWLESFVTLDCYMRRGWNPESAQDALVKAFADTASTELREAADSKDGLFDLPLRADEPSVSGIVRGAPLMYSEHSPYQWTDAQREAFNRGGRR